MPEAYLKELEIDESFLGLDAADGTWHSTVALQPDNLTDALVAWGVKNLESNHSVTFPPSAGGRALVDAGPAEYVAGEYYARQVHGRVNPGNTTSGDAFNGTFNAVIWAIFLPVDTTP